MLSHWCRLQSPARCHSTMAAVGGPLNYINGQRVESTNSNAEDDITVLEPATGYLHFNMEILCVFLSAHVLCGLFQAQALVVLV